VLTPSEIRERLRFASGAVFVSDSQGMADAGNWLATVSGRELLRVDGFARQYRYEGPTLGDAQQWTSSIVNNTEVAAAIGSMHRDGHVRERAVRRLSTSADPLVDRMIAVRADDHVGPVRDLAVTTLMTRTGLPGAESAMAVLQHFAGRSRGAAAAREYEERLIAQHGAGPVWSAFRDSRDRDLRRMAHRRSVTMSLIGASEAAALVSAERDQVVRRLLANVVAEHADTATIREVLLQGRSAESRVLGLVRLGPHELSLSEVQPLLGDSSVLVRFWARRRWSEMDRDVVTACRALIDLAGTPSKQACAYRGLAESGGDIDHEELVRLVRSTEPALQKVGLELLADTALPTDLPDVFRLIRAAHTRVARLASEVLVSNQGLWRLEDISDLKQDPEPELRRRAWWLHRSRGGWDSPIADLQVLQDPDTDLARLGRQPQAPKYLPPTQAQREILEPLLRRAPLSRDSRLELAFAAGLSELATEIRAEPSWRPNDGVQDALPKPDTEMPRLPWWRRLLRG
jgi:hypothetical protein